MAERNCDLQVSASVLQGAADIAERIGAAGVLVCTDALEQGALPERIADKVHFVVRGGTEDPGKHQDIFVPPVPLARMSQIRIAVFAALSRGVVKAGDLVVCLAGMSGTDSIDTIVVTRVGEELYILQKGESGNDVTQQVLNRVVDIAAELGSEGREGVAVGALFVIGDIEVLVPLTRQLVLNPFRGYPASERNVLDSSLEETVKEFATLDGAFLIAPDGTIETCGAFLRTSGPAESDLPSGLGARHHAAAGITAVTDCVAVTVSQSTGTVCVFREGQIVLEIEKPRSALRSGLS